MAFIRPLKKKGCLHVCAPCNKDETHDPAPPLFSPTLFVVVAHTPISQLKKKKNTAQICAVGRKTSAGRGTTVSAVPTTTSARCATTGPSLCRGIAICSKPAAGGGKEASTITRMTTNWNRFFPFLLEAVIGVGVIGR